MLLLLLLLRVCARVCACARLPVPVPVCVCVCVRVRVGSSQMYSTWLNSRRCHTSGLERASEGMFAFQKAIILSSKDAIRW